MLTVVDDLTRSGMFVRRRAPPNERPPFEDRDVESGISQSTCSRKSGDAASDDADSCNW